MEGLIVIACLRSEEQGGEIQRGNVGNIVKARMKDKGHNAN